MTLDETFCLARLIVDCRQVCKKLRIRRKHPPPLGRYIVDEPKDRRIAAPQDITSIFEQGEVRVGAKLSAGVTFEPNHDAESYPRTGRTGVDDPRREPDRKAGFFHSRLDDPVQDPAEQLEADMTENAIYISGGSPATAYGSEDGFSGQIGKYNTAPPVDALNQAQQELAQVKDIMVHNVEQILSRGERIELLVDKTDNMATQSHAFRRGARTIRRQQFWRNQRIVALSVFVGLTRPKDIWCVGKPHGHDRLVRGKSSIAARLRLSQQDNYTHSAYVAEWYNTMSNIPFVLLGLFGAFSARHIPDPARHAAPSIGVAVIGLGSAVFHATLKWHAQVLLDELPMIFLVSLMLYIPSQPLLARSSKSNVSGIPLTPSLYYPNPLLHQVCFAIINLSNTYRTILLFNSAPSTIPHSDLRAAKHYLVSGTLLFIVAFGIWNLDNVYCDTWTWIRSSYLVLGPITQGHAWWHLLTGLGCARITVGTSYLIVSRKYPGVFELTPPVLGLVPVIRQRGKKE
ncbi:Vesicle-associated membrane protein 7B [Ceratobasidium theobromae]|uniref:Vesicle-associated membrane protein 7B n=1 Tax=Ceratobasidium theobromae TaxID=1582974 RepID=A0A5N5QD77_9AGAM|nr:Vesicle-associated membrane protein 7B [Ceratobasidium theobromae]